MSLLKKLKAELKSLWTRLSFCWGSYERTAEGEKGQKMALTWAPCPSLCLHAAERRLLFTTPARTQVEGEGLRSGFVRCSSKNPDRWCGACPVWQSTCPALPVEGLSDPRLTGRGHHRLGGTRAVTSQWISNPLGSVKPALWGLAWNVHRERSRAKRKAEGGEGGWAGRLPKLRQRERAGGCQGGMRVAAGRGSWVCMYVHGRRGAILMNVSLGVYCWNQTVNLMASNNNTNKNYSLIDIKKHGV